MYPAIQAMRPLPQWSTEMVADALEEAADTLRRLPKICWKARLTHWPDVIQESVRQMSEPSRRLKPAAPTPAAIDRMDIVLGWLLPLSPALRKLLWARACGLSWRMLADLDGRSHVTLRKTWQEGLQEIARQISDIR